MTLRALVITMIVLGLTAPAVADPGVTPRELSLERAAFWTDRPDLVLAVERHLTVDPVNLREINRGRDAAAFDLGGWSPHTSRTSASAFNLVVTRTIDALWRAAIADDQGRMDDHLDVQITVIGPSGRTDRLDNQSAPEAFIQITATPTTTVEMQRSSEGRLLEGGAVLEMDLAHATRSGRYQGTVVITVSRL
jgi:hypothetical protein